MLKSVEMKFALIGTLVFSVVGIVSSVVSHNPGAALFIAAMCEVEWLMGVGYAALKNR